MPPSETCEYHALQVADTAVIKAELIHIRTILESGQDEIKEHIDEGEREGGFRDQVRDLKKEVSLMKQERWKIAVTSGVISALFVRLAPETIGAIFSWFIKVIFKI